MSEKKKGGKGRTKEQGTKQLLRSPRVLSALIQMGDVRVTTIRGYAAGVERAAERWAKNANYTVTYEVLEWEDNE